jgi:hypothetical protein
MTCRRSPTGRTRSCSHRRMRVIRCTQVSSPLPRGRRSRRRHYHDSTSRPGRFARSSGSTGRRRSAPWNVEPPQKRFEHVQGGAGQRPPMLAGLAICAVVGRRSGPDAGFGVPVERVRGRGRKIFSRCRRRQSKDIAVLSDPPAGAPSIRAKLSALTRQWIFGKLAPATALSFPALPVARPASQAGFAFLGAGCSQVDDSPRACRKIKRSAKPAAQNLAIRRISAPCYLCTSSGWRGTATCPPRGQGESALTLWRGSFLYQRPRTGPLPACSPGS